MSRAHAVALRVSVAVLQAVAESAGPVPEGPLYAVATSSGCTLEQWEAIVSALVETGMLQRVGRDQIRATPKGRALAATTPTR